jgi:hypothetical protein
VEFDGNDGGFDPRKTWVLMGIIWYYIAISGIITASKTGITRTVGPKKIRDLTLW